MLKRPKPLTIATLEDNMVLVKGGEFEMGGEGHEDEKPVQKVQLKDFYLGKIQVTQALWQDVMGQDPEELAFPHPQRPVEGVSWYDCIEFCNKLSCQQGFRPAYGIDKDSNDPGNQNRSDDQKWTVTIIDDADGYHLPTEAECEYAARGGLNWQKHQYEFAGSTNNNEIGWRDLTSHNISQPVALRPPNPLGLFDMSGNVREWCWDWYGSEYYQTNLIQKTPKQPTGPKSGSSRMVRGGSWLYDGVLLRVAYRDNDYPYDCDDNLGLRLCRYPL